MGRGTRAPALAAGLLAASLAGCGDGPPVLVSPSPPTSERARLLASCPAKAPAWEAGLVPVTDDADTRRRQALVKEAADVADAYLAGLPADQVGVLRTEQARQAVVVQVTRDAERVVRELRARIGAGVRAEVETVRYSRAELERAEATIRGIDGLDWTSLGTGANGRVEVSVSGDAVAAEALIAGHVDRCMFTVDRGATVPAG